MKIGIAQIACGVHRVDHNLRKHMHLLQQACQQACDYVLFPELSLTGPFHWRLHAYTRTFLESVIEGFHAFSQRNNISFTIGIPSWHGCAIRNSALTFTHDGRIIEHQKYILSQDELDYVQPGISQPCFELKGKSIAILVGSASLEANNRDRKSAQRADLLCVGTALSIEQHLSLKDTFVQISAQYNIVALANHAFSPAAQQYCGMSFIRARDCQSRINANRHEGLFTLQLNSV